MTRILIFDGAPRASQDAVAQHGGPDNATLFGQAVALHVPEAICVPLNVADGEHLPAGSVLTDFDGVVITGSPLNIYDPIRPVTRQIGFARKLLGIGLPVWGSCWGLQLAVTALGGVVRRNPRGREIGIARNITLSACGRGHPLFVGKADAFDALCSHEDEVETLPAVARVLAGNGISAVQAVEIEGPGGSFLGVQYHPEHTPQLTAALLDLRQSRLVEDGFGRSPADLAQMADDLRALEADPGRRDLAWRYGLDRHILDPMRKIRRFWFVRIRA